MIDSPIPIMNAFILGSIMAACMYDLFKLRDVEVQKVLAKIER
ncbi:MAG: hypothetical protein AAFW81_05635 [Pseudomonadota bacterium]